MRATLSMVACAAALWACGGSTATVGVSTDGGSSSGGSGSGTGGSSGSSGSGGSSGTSTGSTGSPGGGGSEASTENCSTSLALAGASYDIIKSRFAFGSTPSPQDAGSLVRWVGSHGVVAIFSDGSELASMDANAPEANLPSWSNDPTVLTAQATDYWVSMGVASCQIMGAGIDGSVSGGSSSGGGSTMTAGPSDVTLSRGISGVRVVESLAVASFDVDDQTTYESFYWPEIPADVVTAAVAFQNQLKDPKALAAYMAKLPADAQGQGSVVIHHTSAGSSSPFQTAATYEVLTPGPFGGDLNFDQNGNPVTTVW